ncbi:BEN domain-containing protein 2 [Rhinophrynus dorsalis]
MQETFSSLQASSVSKKRSRIEDPGEGTSSRHIEVDESNLFEDLSDYSSEEEGEILEEDEALRIFSKILAVALEPLRRRGKTILPYLDYLLIVSQSLTHSDNLATFTEFGLVGELPKEPSTAFSASKLPGHDLQHREEFSDIILFRDARDHQPGQELQETPGTRGPRVYENIRSNELLHSHCAVGQYSHKISSEPVPIPLEQKSSKHFSKDSSNSTSKVHSIVVDGSKKSEEGNLSLGSAVAKNLDSRKSVRMGVMLEQHLPSRCMVSARKNPPHKCSRAKGDTSLLEGLKKKMYQESTSTDHIRQHGGCTLYQKPGRDKKQSPEFGIKKDNEVVRKELSGNISYSHSRSSKPSRRLPKQEQAEPRRVVTQRGNIQSDCQRMGKSSDRPYGNLGEHEVQHLLQDKTSKSLGSGCRGSVMELSPIIYISSHPNDSEGSKEDQIRGSKCHSHSCRMAEKSMVLGIDQPSNRGSMAPSEQMRIQEQEYDENTSVMYDYDPEYDGASVISEASYTGDQQRTLTEVLNYCQVMYDAIQKLDKKVDFLQRKVSDLHQARIKPPFKPRPVNFPHRSSYPVAHGKIRLQKLNQRLSGSDIPVSSQGPYSPSLRIRVENSQRPSQRRPIPSIPQTRETPQNLQRQSPPLPTIISTHSLQSSIPDANKRIAVHKPPQTVMETLPESSCVSSPVMNVSLVSPTVRPTTSETCVKQNDTFMITSDTSLKSIVISDELPSSSVPTHSEYAFLGDPNRKIKVPGNYLMKARQKSKPKYAARFLFRALFSNETLLCSNVGTGASGMNTLDNNVVSAIREFLASAFPAYDLDEFGKDWKICTTHVNAMIRCLQFETNAATAKSNPNQVNSQVTSICVDSDAEEEQTMKAESPQISQKTAISTTTTVPANPKRDIREHDPQLPGPSVTQSSADPMEYLGEKSRNVQLPVLVLYKGKEKPRPELCARFLIRHLFSEEVLVKSNVYGNADRGVLPLDLNKIGALKEFLRENYPTFDLKESGLDWKACVAAINSTIRSLRHDQKKAATQIQKKTPSMPSLDQPLQIM